MSSEKTILEIIAPTEEEAIANGLEQLGVPRDSVEVEILDSGNPGFLGIGARQARIRLTINMAADSSSEDFEGVLIETAPRAAQKVVSSSVLDDDETVLDMARTIVSELLEKMRVRAAVTTHFVDAEDEKDQRHVMIEIHGDDLSILIGRHSETLNALQYITSMILGKEMGHWVPLTLDVQGYRSRRETQLRRLAVKLAEQAVQSGRRQVLEPMPANERRIVHLELSTHPEIVTESVGDEPNRKVTIILKK
jgi:spoIIIJ-associated protein